MTTAKLWGTALMTAALAVGCSGGGGGDGTDDGKGPGDHSGTDGGVHGGGDGGTDAGNNPGLNLPFPKEEACESLSDEASLTKKPVDIIVVIDNSGSMTAEIVAVENNINVNFAQIIEQSGIDYRVILLAKHGSAA
ncbi:MAG: hypothetical protein WBV82_12460, partial [Myxococcaceae bacterium]